MPYLLGDIHYFLNSFSKRLEIKDYACMLICLVI